MGFLKNGQKLKLRVREMVEIWLRLHLKKSKTSFTIIWLIRLLGMLMFGLEPVAQPRMLPAGLGRSLEMLLLIGLIPTGITQLVDLLPMQIGTVSNSKRVERAAGTMLLALKLWCMSVKRQQFLVMPPRPLLQRQQQAQLLPAL